MWSSFLDSIMGSVQKKAYSSESETIVDLRELEAKLKVAGNTQIFRQNDLTDSGAAEISTLYDPLSTTESDQRELLENSYNLSGMESSAEKWMATVEQLIVEEEYDAAKEKSFEIETLSANCGDVCGEAIGAGLGFWACVNNNDEKGAWTKFWQFLRLILKIAGADVRKLDNPLVQRLGTESVDEFYELLVDKQCYWRSTLCLRAGIAVDAIFSNFSEISSSCFQGLDVADEEAHCLDAMSHGDAHKILYRVFKFVRQRYNTTMIDEILADQSFQLLLLHDCMLLYPETSEAAAFLKQEWEQFGACDYVKAVERLRTWIGEFTIVPEKSDDSNINNESFAAWQLELKIKSCGFLGLYHSACKDYTKAEANLFKSISLTLDCYKDLDIDGNITDVVDLFGDAYFNTLGKLRKFDLAFAKTFDQHLGKIEAEFPFKYILEYRFGKWLFEAGNEGKDNTSTERSLELLWKSSRGLVDVNIEYAIQAYGDSTGVAMIVHKDNFDKSWEIVEEALTISEIRNDEYKRLWKVLGDVAENSRQRVQNGESINDIQRAMRGLEKAQSLAMQVVVERDRIYFQSRIRLLMAESLMDYSNSCEDVNTQEQLNKAIEHLEAVCAIYKLDGAAIDLDESELREEARKLLIHAYGMVGKYGQSAETLCHSFPDSHRYVLLKSAEAMSWSSSGSYVEAIQAINEAISMNKSSLDWKLQVSLLFKRSSIHQKAGEMEKRLKDMEDAKKRCKADDFLIGDNIDIIEGLISLLEYYIESKDDKSAWELVRDIDYTANTNFADGRSEKFLHKFVTWEHLKSKLLLQALPDGKESSFYRNEISPDISGPGLISTPHLVDAMCNTEMLLATRHAIIDEEKLVIGRDGRPSDDVPTFHSRTLVSEFQCYKYLTQEDGASAIQELQKGIDYLESLPSGSRRTHVSIYTTQDIMNLYALKAVVCAAFGLLDQANMSIDKARILMEKLQEESCDRKYLKAKYYVDLYGNASSQLAAEAGRRLIADFSGGQLQIPSALEFGWVQSLDDKAILHRNMERIAVEQERPSEALVWAERGQMRLFMHIVENNKQFQASTSIPVEGKFDEDDEYAAEILTKVMEACPSDVVIVKYSYFDQDESLVVYLLTKEKWSMRLILDIGGEFFRLLSSVKTSGEGHDPKHHNRLKFRQYITTLLQKIKMKDDATSKRYLGILFQLILRPELDRLQESAYHKLVFAHHGFLSSIPLHALYDDSTEKFLIQQKIVCYIPSIRVLGYCYSQQDEFLKTFRRGELNPPFLAGDPEPMGRDKKKLVHSRKEAQEVAKVLLGDESQAFVGEKVTKHAVKEALCNSWLTLLSTHCIDNALIMQRRGPRQQQAASENPVVETEAHQSLDNKVATMSSCIAEVAADGSRSGVDEEELIRGITVSMDGDFDEEELTIAEILQLRVRSGVVVFDGCGTNEGQVSQEGLLGLGRALLLAGAPMAILTLWSVNDKSTRSLVTSMFTNAKVDQLDVLGSLQKAMTDMIKEGSYHIYNWAPLIALGSPTMKLVYP